MEHGTPAQTVGNQFVQQYYTVLHSSPKHLHRFYADQSTLTYADVLPEAAGVSQSLKTATGQKMISEMVINLGYEETMTEIYSVDAQYSLEGSVVVQVTGALQPKGRPKRPFVQTFFLAVQEKGYFVLNDIFRYLMPPSVGSVASSLTGDATATSTSAPAAAAAAPRSTAPRLPAGTSPPTPQQQQQQQQPPVPRAVRPPAPAAGPLPPHANGLPPPMPPIHYGVVPMGGAIPVVGAPPMAVQGFPSAAPPPAPIPHPPPPALPPAPVHMPGPLPTQMPTPQPQPYPPSAGRSSSSPVAATRSREPPAGPPATVSYAERVRQTHAAEGGAPPPSKEQAQQPQQQPVGAASAPAAPPPVSLPTWEAPRTDAVATTATSGTTSSGDSMDGVDIPPACGVFIRDIPQEVTVETLGEALSKFGPLRPGSLSLKLQRGRDSYAFVDFLSAEAAAACVSQGMEVQGRRVMTQPKRPLIFRQGGGRGGMGGGGGGPRSDRSAGFRGSRGSGGSGGPPPRGPPPGPPMQPPPTYGIPYPPHHQYMMVPQMMAPMGMQPRPGGMDGYMMGPGGLPGGRGGGRMRYDGRGQGRGGGGGGSNRPGPPPPQHLQTPMPPPPA